VAIDFPNPRDDPVTIITLESSVMAILRVELVGDDDDDADADDNDEYCGRLVGTNACVVDTRRIATAVAVAITIVFKAGDARFMILVFRYCCWARVDIICCCIRS